jgi:hypothetical protein
MDNWYNEEYESVRQWNELIAHPYFVLLKSKIQLDLNNLQREIDKLVSIPSLDNSIHATALAKSKERLISLLRHFDYMLEKKLQLDKEVAKRKEKSAI